MPHNEFGIKTVVDGKSSSFWYHTTPRKNLESILKNGLKVNSTPSFSMASLEYMEDIYGMVPIFLAKSSTHYGENSDDSVVLKVDTSGLELVADIPTLASDFGAYIEEDHVWFEQDDKKAPAWGRREESISYEDLLGGEFTEKAIRTTKTCAVMQNIAPERIKLLVKEAEEEKIEKFISLGDLVVNYDSLFDAYTDCRYKKACSKSEGPIRVFEVEDEKGRYQLFDGYHRLFEYLIDLKHQKNTGMVPVVIDNSYLTKQYWAVTPKSKRWFYNPSKKYGNLEVFFHKDGKKELDLFASSR